MNQVKASVVICEAVVGCQVAFVAPYKMVDFEKAVQDMNTKLAKGSIHL